MDTTSPTPKPRGRWLRKIIWLFGLFVILLVAVYFVATSGAFFKGVILPKIADSMNAEITVGDVSISPFSQVVLTDLKVQGKGAEPLLAAQKITARYNLRDIIGGKITVQEVTIDTPLIEVITHPDGTSNLDPLLQKSPSEDKPSEKSSKSEPVQLNIQKVAINNGAVRIVKNYGGDRRDLTEVGNLNFALENLRTGQPAKMTMSAAVKVDNQPPAPATNGMLSANVTSDFGFLLTPTLELQTLKGNAALTVQQGQGAFADLTGVGATFDGEITPTEIKQIALNFKRQNANLATISLSGPFNAATHEGQLMLAVQSIDRQVLNLAGAAAGIDFGSTAINATNLIDITKGGSMVQSAGRFNVQSFSITRQNQSTPTVQLQLDYGTVIDLSNKTARLQSFTLNGTQNDRLLLRGTLPSPMDISLGGTNNAMGNSALQLLVTNFSLADWKPFLGGLNAQGMLNAHMDLVSQQGGQQLSLEMNSGIRDLAMELNTNQVTRANVVLALRASVANMQRVDLREARIELTQQNAPILQVSSSGTYGISNQAANLRVTLDSSLPGLLATFPQTNVAAARGALKFAGQITQTNADRTINGTLSLADFTGNYSEYRFTNFNTALNLDVISDARKVEIRQAGGNITSQGAPGGSFNLAGTYDLANAAFTGALKLDDLNRNALAPFLAPSLPDKSLVSISVNGNATAQYATDATSIKADFKVSNLVVQEAQQPKPNPPLEARLELDVAQRKKTIDIAMAQVTLSPTARAKNQLKLSGQLDLSDTNATQGNLKLVSDALDLTTYCDLVAAKTNAATPTPAPATSTPPTTAKSGPPTEPKPVSLPLRNFTLEMNLGAVYLRDLHISNLQTATRIDGSNVVVKPFQLGLNGAPVTLNATLNLGVPGYQYDVSLGSGSIPLEPIANTFMPEKRGMYKGDLLANAQIKGAGVTGINLRKSLQGQITFSFTNADLQIINPKLTKVLTPIGIALAVPDVAKRPLNYVNFGAKMGNGQITVDQLSLASSAFFAKTQGAIPIADDLMNSPLNDLPVEFSLARAMAERIRLAPKNASSEPYVKLPNFLQVTGTLDDPRSKIEMSPLALAGAVLEKFADKIPGVDEKTSNLLKGVGSLLTGNKGATNTATTTTNQAPGTTNKAAPPVFNPLDLLRKPKK